MSTHNIQFHNKIRKKIPEYLFFLSYRKGFVGTEKRVRIIQGKRAIRVRAIEVILYVFENLCEVKPFERCPNNSSRYTEYLDEESFFSCSSNNYFNANKYTKSVFFLNEAFRMQDASAGCLHMQSAASDFDHNENIPI